MKVPRRVTAIDRLEKAGRRSPAIVPTPLAGGTPSSNQGTIFAPDNYTAGIGSNAPGEKSVCYAPIKIPDPVPLTGLSYEVGGTKNGKVIVALLSPAGALLAKSAAAEQASAEFFQRLAFESPLELSAPGVYWGALVMETATGTFQGAYQMSPWKKETLGSFAMPGSFSPPTGLNNTGAKCPFLATY